MTNVSVLPRESTWVFSHPPHPKHEQNLPRPRCFAPTHPVSCLKRSSTQSEGKEKDCVFLSPPHHPPKWRESLHQFFHLPSSLSSERRAGFHLHPSEFAAAVAGHPALAILGDEDLRAYRGAVTRRVPTRFGHRKVGFGGVFPEHFGAHTTTVNKPKRSVNQNAPKRGFFVLFFSGVQMVTLYMVGHPFSNGRGSSSISLNLYPRSPVRRHFDQLR